MRHLITPTRRALRRMLVVLLALVALVNVAAFLLTPLLDRYHDELAALASEHFGMPITVGKLHARWRGFGPELVLKDLRIGKQTSGQGLHLTETAVDFGVWDMIRHLDLSPLRVSLRNLELHLVRHADGRVELMGFDGDGMTSSANGKMPFSGRLRLEDVTLLWEDRRHNLPVQRFEQAQLRLHLWPDRLSLSARLNLPGQQPGKLRVAANITLLDDDWSGEIYLAGEIPDLPPQVAPYLPSPLALTAGGAIFELWSDWHHSKLVSSEGHLTLNTVQLQQGNGGPELDLQHASTDFHYQRDGEHRQLDLAKLSLERQGRRWPMGNLHLNVDLTTPDRPTLQLAADYLRLADLAALSRPWPLPADWAPLRDGLQPDGELTELRLAIHPAPDPSIALPQWQLSAHFSQLRSQAWQEYPGVENISGQVRGDHQKLQIHVAATNSKLDWPTLFREPLPVDQLKGVLTWEALPGGGHQLASHGLLLDSPDIRSVSRLRLDIPADGDMDIDLHSELRQGDGRHTPRYLPTRHMSAELVDWLDHAITSGHVPQGTLLLRGPLKDFPFDKTHNGRFEVRFDVTDLTLDYLADWPPLQIANAEVIFHNNALSIDLKHGTLYNSQVDGTHAHIASLEPISPLSLKGKVTGPLNDPLRLLTESPLKKSFGEIASLLKVKGSSELTLDMDLDLDDTGKDRLAASLTLQGNDIHLPAQKLTLNQAKGKIAFTLDEVNASDLQAKMLGQPVRIDISPSGKNHQLTAQTRIDVATLRQRLPDLPDKLLQGDSELRVTLDIPNTTSNQSPTLTLASNLKGMAVDLPAPLGKTTEQDRPLNVQIPLAHDKPWIRLRYDDTLEALFRPDGDRIGIQLGGDTAKLPDEAVLQLSGRLPALSLDPWLAWAEQPSATKTQLPPLRAALHLGQLRLGRTRIDDVQIDLDQQGDGWQGHAESVRFAGQFEIPGKGSNAPIKLDLKRFSLDLNNDDDEGTKSATPDAGRPSDWPAMDIEVAALRINGKDFGHFSTKARHVDQSLKFEPITLNGPLARFEGMLQWRGEGHQADTDLVGKLHAPRLGKTLEALGYSPQFKDAAADADLRLGWPGNPGAGSLATLRGQVTLAIAQGQLLELEPGVTRAFGLLNFGAIQRRLRLDFSDLFGKGLSFDKITGNFRLIDGNAYTSDLSINGPSGDILITGRTGLLQQDLYQEVAVTPRFDATLPVAGAIAGGPLAGVAVLVAQVVMKDKVDDFNRIKYRVTGSWKDPQVEQQQGGGLSRILQPVTDLFDGKPSTSDQTDDTLH